MSEKRVVLLVCKCGRVKKHDKWFMVQSSFSAFIRMAIAQDVDAIDFPLTKCDFCKEAENALSKMRKEKTLDQTSPSAT
jgi:hypothetical protein